MNMINQGNFSWVVSQSRSAFTSCVPETHSKLVIKYGLRVYFSTIIQLASQSYSNGSNNSGNPGSDNTIKPRTISASWNRLKWYFSTRYWWETRFNVTRMICVYEMLCFGLLVQALKITLLVNRWNGYSRGDIWWYPVRPPVPSETGTKMCPRISILIFLMLTRK